MDPKDRQIVRALQRDGRITNQELAEQVNLSPSPCLRRLRNLEASGAITGYSAKVDPKVYGLPVTVFVRVRLERHDAKDVARFEARVRDTEEILDCHVLAGAMDYQLRVLVSGLDDYEDFVRQRIHTIGGIASIETTFAYGTLKEGEVYPNID